MIETIERRFKHLDLIEKHTRFLREEVADSLGEHGSNEFDRRFAEHLLMLGRSVSLMRDMCAQYDAGEIQETERVTDAPVAGKAKDQEHSALKLECSKIYRSGSKIDAIRLWRKETGAGLKEAKDAVESLSKMWD